MRHPFYRLLPLVCVFLLFGAPAQAAESALGNAAQNIAGQIDKETAVHYATGINPADYPCARAALNKLYDSRAEIASLKSYNPRRAFSWLTDQFSYYSAKLMRFFMGLFDKGSVDAGIRNVSNLAQGGRMSNPLAGMDSQIDGWIENLGPRSQQVFADQVRSVISRTTAADGTCK